MSPLLPPPQTHLNVDSMLGAMVATLPPWADMKEEGKAGSKEKGGGGEYTLATQPF